MKKICVRLLFLLLGYLMMGEGFAQNMGAVNAIHTQQMQMGLQRISMQKANTNGLSNRRYIYRVELNSGAILTVTSKIEFDESGSAYLLLEDRTRKKNDSLRTQKIWPQMTKSITRLTPSLREVIKGNPADSCWLFKTVAGAINAYSFLPETYALHMGYLKMVQKGDGALLPMTKQNLETYLNDDRQALVLFQQELYFQAIEHYNNNRRRKARG